MASSDQVEARVQYPRLGAGRYKIEAIRIPAVPAVVNVEAECVVLAVNPIAVRTLADRFARPIDGRTADIPAAVGLLVVIATPEGDE